GRGGGGGGGGARSKGGKLGRGWGIKWGKAEKGEDVVRDREEEVMSIAAAAVQKAVTVDEDGSSDGDDAVQPEGVKPKPRFPHLVPMTRTHSAQPPPNPAPQEKLSVPRPPRKCLSYETLDRLPGSHPPADDNSSSDSDQDNTEGEGLSVGASLSQSLSTSLPTTMSPSSRRRKIRKFRRLTRRYRIPGSYTYGHVDCLGGRDAGRLWKRIVRWLDDTVERENDWRGRRFSAR
ncbi:hypothetical protein HK097_003237, partial [Rhizophlyctis rosea]